MSPGYELLERLHLRNFPKVPWDVVKIRELIDDYDLSAVLSSTDHWFVRTLTAVAHRQNLHIHFHDVGSDVGSLLVHLGQDFGWDVDDYGEGAIIRFPRSRKEVFLSREARNPVTGRGCDSATVQRLQPRPNQG